MAESRPTRTAAMRSAADDLQRFGMLAYYPTRDAWGARGYQTKTIQALVNAGLAWCGPLAAYPVRKP